MQVTVWNPNKIYMGSCIFGTLRLIYSCNSLLRAHSFRNWDIIDPFLCARLPLRSIVKSRPEPYQIHRLITPVPKMLVSPPEP